MSAKSGEIPGEDRVASGGLLHRRVFLRRSLTLAGAAGLGLGIDSQAAKAADTDLKEPFPEWMTRQGGGRSAYGSPSPFEESVKRGLSPENPVAPGVGISTTPLEHLNGTITPNGLHFERHHSSVPRIDPDKHQLKIHGKVRQPLVYDVESLLRYPLRSRFHFLECSGNSFRNMAPEAPQMTCSDINGLLSCAEWTGVPLSVLLDEAGLDSDAAWVVAEGADASGMVRSIPLEKARDDVLIALYQNGERLRPEQGYPMRLFVPGWEGNVSVKWLHRLKVTDAPVHSRTETDEYTDLLPDGRALQFTFAMGVKSVITRPSAGLTMQEPGYYELSGLAWSGHGTITRVEVSADGGRSWAEAELDPPLMPRCLARFRVPWEWSGEPAVLVSRAYDDAGNAQPDRDTVVNRYSSGNFYHYNGFQSWAVAANGEVRNVYV